MNDEPCLTHEMQWCAICNGDDKPEKSNYSHKIIIAQYRGYCPRCSETIEPGELITYSNNWMSYIHGDC
jgi:hypothetical protein